VYLAVAVFIVFIGFIIYNMFFVEGNDRTHEQQANQPLMDEAQTSAEDGPGAEAFIITETPYEAPGKLKLRMRAKQDVWAMVVRDGDTVLNRRLDAGDERAWEADYRYHLTIGISTAVDLFVNDLKLAPLSDQARTVSGLEINQVNFKEYLPAPVDTLSRVSPGESLGPSNATVLRNETPSKPVSGGNAADTSGKESSDGD